MMKYNVNEADGLIIENDFGNAIFAMSKDKNWLKYEFDQNGKIIYFQRQMNR